MMVRKSTKDVIVDSAKGFYEDIKNSLLAMVGDFLEIQLRSIGAFIRNIPKLKEKIKKMVVGFSLALAGMILVLFGFSEFLSVLFGVETYLMHMMFGAFVILLALLYSKS